MKAIAKDGTKYNVTFPTSSYHFGHVKINGVDCGTWIENCEGYWHVKFEFNGRQYHAWSKWGKKSMMEHACNAIGQFRSVWE